MDVQGFRGEVCCCRAVDVPWMPLGASPLLHILSARQASVSCGGHGEVMWQHWCTRRPLWWPHFVSHMRQWAWEGKTLALSMCTSQAGVGRRSRFNLWAENKGRRIRHYFGSNDSSRTCVTLASVPYRTFWVTLNLITCPPSLGQRLSYNLSSNIL